MLHDEGLLEFNFGLMQWVWDTPRIESHTTATVNVVDMMGIKMKRLPEAMTRLLLTASCLGSSFDLSSLRYVWDAESNTQELDVLLTRAVDEGFLELHGTTSYQWVHDKIQEAAMSLLPSDVLRDLQFELGQKFVRSESELEDSIFMVVDLMNQRPMYMDTDERVKVAALNLQAAKKAVELSAFPSASKYCEKGNELLPSKAKWSLNYNLTLDLLSTVSSTRTRPFMKPSQRFRSPLSILLTDDSTGCRSRRRTWACRKDGEILR